MGDFKRRFDNIEQLKSEKLFRERLLNDIHKGEVFAFALIDVEVGLPQIVSVSPIDLWV